MTGMAESVRAVRIHDYGGPDMVRLDRIPCPVPQEGAVRVRAHAFGVNPVDWKIREGQRRARMPLALPAVIGCDVAGTVDMVGPGVSGVAVGEPVFAMVGLHGAFAEAVVLPAAQVVRKPERVDFVTAAAVPLAALTAWQGLQLGGIAAGQRVLVHAASGGVGGFALQIARALGAEVIATCSAANMERVRALGASRVIDYASTRFEQAVADMDIVLDLLGGETQDRSWQVLRPDGALISTIGVPDAGDPRPQGRRAARVGVRPVGSDLAEIARLIEAGRIAVHLDAVMPMEQAADALERVRTGHVRGKIALTPA
jgi:NADPH:quinone reductase-like Zn-dependent oxidoreductase